MIADAWHECKNRKLWNVPTGSIDIPIRVHDRWMIMVANGDTDTEVPIVFCPWCGLDLIKACQSRSPKIKREISVRYYDRSVEK